jgi:hypothetical protein
LWSGAPPTPQLSFDFVDFRNWQLYSLKPDKSLARAGRLTKDPLPKMETCLCSRADAAAYSPKCSQTQAWRGSDHLVVHRGKLCDRQIHDRYKESKSFACRSRRMMLLDCWFLSRMTRGSSLWVGGSSTKPQPILRDSGTMLPLCPSSTSPTAWLMRSPLGLCVLIGSDHRHGGTTIDIPACRRGSFQLATALRATILPLGGHVRCSRTWCRLAQCPCRTR